MLRPPLGERAGSAYVIVSIRWNRSGMQPGGWLAEWVVSRVVGRASHRDLRSRVLHNGVRWKELNVHRQRRCTGEVLDYVEG